VNVFSFPLLQSRETNPKSLKRKLFIYGGDFERGFTKYVASLTGQSNPKICFQSGNAAGYSVCWLKTQGITDSRPGKLTTVDGLGYIPGSNCPHYDAESERMPLYWSKIKTGEFKAGFACEDKAGIYFENGEVKQAFLLVKIALPILLPYQEVR